MKLRSIQTRSLLLCVVLSAFVARTDATPPVVERVTTIAPFPRGLAMSDGKLYVLCRGRVRDAGGVSATVNDQAGTLYAVDPNVAESITVSPVSEAVRTNGIVVALPTEPPFKLWNRSAFPPEKDRETDRPYCTLRFHDATRSFYLCGFSGIDKSQAPGQTPFSKNLSDALFRYDLRTKRWYEVERHSLEAGGNYPHHDPSMNPPPHGWLNGPDNCLALGNWLYAVAKDNSRLVVYDLAPLAKNPEAGPPQSYLFMGEEIRMRDEGVKNYSGQSALAFHDGCLYVGYRTSSVIVRFRLGRDYLPVKPIQAELVARFDPYDPGTGKSANITDMGFDDKGRLYVISAMPARVYRFTPDPKNVFDAREKKIAPWADLAALTGVPRMKSENVLFHGGHLYVTSGDGYAFQEGATGTVFRLRVAD